MRLIFLFALFISISGLAISEQDFMRVLRAQRQINAQRTKGRVMAYDAKKPMPSQDGNGDESLYEDLRGSFNKSLLHLPTGFPNREAFESLRYALVSGKPSEFLNILIGTGIKKLVNPQASLAFTLTANDGWINAIRPAPTFASAETAGEMVEDYWTTLCRDVPFNKFDTNSIALLAINDLNQLSDFRGPKENGIVTPQTFLRGNTPGDLIGPYISQFLYLSIPYGNDELDPEQMVPKSGMQNDFITTFPDWLTVQTGGVTNKSIDFENAPIFIRTPRDLAEYVHQDTPGLAAFSAMLILNEFGPAALDPSNPYFHNPTQEGFVTFGISQVTALMLAAVHAGLKAAWCHKWQINRRLRPEEFGFYVQQQVAEGNNMGIHPELIQSDALHQIFLAFGSYFLPQAYPEGSPCHPSYPAGHATFLGAAVTILKAFYNEDFVIPNPLEPNTTNDNLVSYPGILTVGNELNKLAANIALGRDHAGVHYRSDGIEGLLLGEKVALDILDNDAFLFNEEFEGYSLTKFDGTKVIVGKKRSTP